MTPLMTSKERLLAALERKVADRLPVCDVEAVNREADSFGRRGLVRGAVCA